MKRFLTELAETATHAALIFMVLVGWWYLPLWFFVGRHR